MYAGHQLCMLGILLIVLQQQLACLLIQRRLWEGFYQQTPASAYLLSVMQTNEISSNMVHASTVELG